VDDPILKLIVSI